VKATRSSRPAGSSGAGLPDRRADLPGHALRSPRTVGPTITDAQTVEAIRQVAWATDTHSRRRLAPEGLYGRRKMLGYLRRGGLEVTAGSVDRGMRLYGPVRGGPWQTAPHHHRRPGRRPGAGPAEPGLYREAPNLKWVTDFT